MYRIQLFADIKNAICSYANSKGNIRVDILKSHFHEIESKLQMSFRFVVQKLVK